MTKYTALVIAAFLMGGIMILKHYYSDYPDDNVFEENVEKVISLETGLDVDLTLASKE